MNTESLGITTSEFTPLRPVTDSINDSAIVLAQYEDYDMKRIAARLIRAGYTNLITLHGLDHVELCLSEERCDLLFLDLNNSSEVNKTLAFLERQRRRGFRGMAALTARTTTRELFFRAARCGANDFLIKGRNLDIVAEADHLLGSGDEMSQSGWDPDKLASVGFLRTLGITKSEMGILIEFTRDFSKQKRLAQRVSISEPGVRKSFSRIYKKLSRVFEIENSAQLSHILTICSLYA